jgi:mannitol-specific phosphotransferase system IIBC component
MAAERNGGDGVVATPSATASIKGPSMTAAFTLYFVIPLVCLGLASIFGPGVIPANQKETRKSRHVPIQVNVPSAASSGNGAASLMHAKVTDEQHRQRQEQKKQRKKKNNSKKIKSQYEQVR